MATTSQGGSRTEGQDWGDGDLNHLKSLEYPERMTHFIRGSTRHVSRGVTVLDFRPLYAVTIHHIQRQLAKEISLISESYVTDDQLETIRQLLGKYSASKVPPPPPPVCDVLAVWSTFSLKSPSPKLAKLYVSSPLIY